MTTVKPLTLREAKTMSAASPVAGRKYPRPGYEKLVLTRNEPRTVIGLDNVTRTYLCVVRYYLENSGGSLRLREYFTA